MEPVSGRPQPGEPPRRTVVQGDAIAWLRGQETLAGSSVFTSMPDLSEIPALDLAGWRRWTIETCTGILALCPDDGVVIFYQTDIRHDRRWIDKAYLCQTAAEASGHALLWHKIVCRIPAGKVSHGRPAYSHMLCFSRSMVPDLAMGTPDVIPELGRMTWSRAMGLGGARVAIEYIRAQTRSHTVVDPFCGVGTALAMANAAGLHAVGVELSPRRVRRARVLQLRADEYPRHWPGRWVPGEVGAEIARAGAPDDDH